MKPGLATSSCHPTSRKPSSASSAPRHGNTSLHLSLLWQNLPTSKWEKAAAGRTAKRRGEGKGEGKGEEREREGERERKGRRKGKPQRLVYAKRIHQALGGCSLLPEPWPGHGRVLEGHTEALSRDTVSAPSWALMPQHLNTKPTKGNHLQRRLLPKSLPTPAFCRLVCVFHTLRCYKGAVQLNTGQAAIDT